MAGGTVKKAVRVVSKRSITSEVIAPFEENGALMCTVGGRPELDRTRAGRRLLRTWQDEAFKALRAAYFAILIAPTGSGKSALQKALAWLRVLNGEKVIIAVPMTDIGDSFRTLEKDEAGKFVEYVLPSGMTMRWTIARENFLIRGDGSTRITDKGTIERVKEFIRSPAAVEVDGRVLVCTHAALVVAHQELLKEWGRRRGSPYASAGATNLFIDEAHHCRILDEGEYSAEDEDRCNRLGDIVEHYVANECGRMLLTTATWLRGDGETIVPRECLPAFKTHEYAIDAYLASMNHLKHIGFRMTVADSYEKALRAEVSGERRLTKTIVALPRVKAHEGSQKKLQNLADLRPVLGASKAISHEGAVRSHNGCVSVDMVNPNGRDDVRAWFDGVKNTSESPHVVFVQNLFREGANWPAAERYIVLGPRGSLPMLIQMIGRLLRDYDAKGYVEFHIVLLRDEIESNVDQFTRFMDTIFKVMALGWQFTVDLQLPEKVRTQRIIRAISKEFRKQAVVGTKVEPGETVRDALRGALAAEGLKLTQTEQDKVAKSLFACLGPAFKAAANSLVTLMNPDEQREFAEKVKTDPFNALGNVCRRVNAAHFATLRAQWTNMPAVTPEYVNRLIILNRCKYFQNKGQYVDPRTIPGLAKYFGGAEAFDAALRAEGM